MNKEMKEKSIETAKLIWGLMSDYGSVMLSCGIIRAILPPGVHIIAKGGMLLGGILLGDFLGDRLTKYGDEVIPETIDDLDETISEIKKNIDIIRDKDLEEEKDDTNQE